MEDLIRDGTPDGDPEPLDISEQLPEEDVDSQELPKSAAQLNLDSRGDMSNAVNILGGSSEMDLDLTQEF